MKYIGSNNIETNRLILRKLTVQDAYKAFENWCNRDNVDKYVLWKKHENADVTLRQYENWVLEYENPKTFRWIVELKENKDVIGTIDVSKRFLKYGTCEIGYCYGDKFWNKGYATESLKAVIKYLFEEADADLICAEYMSNNPASGKVMKKSGMKYESILRSRVIDKDNERNDLINYSITKEEYFNSKSCK